MILEKCGVQRYFKFSGFTLAELLVVLTIIGLLSFFGIPIGQSLVHKSYRAKVVAEIENAVLMARTTALATNETLLITPLVADSWSYGIVLLKDNTQHRFSETAQILHQWQWNCSGLNVEWNGFISKQYLLFAPRLSQSALSGSFTVKNKATVDKKIIVNRLGHIRQAEL